MNEFHEFHGEEIMKKYALVEAEVVNAEKEVQTLQDKQNSSEDHAIREAGPNFEFLKIYAEPRGKHAQTTDPSLGGRLAQEAYHSQELPLPILYLFFASSC